MTAPTRRSDAANSLVAFAVDDAHALWRTAVAIRREWLGHGLSTEPADRETAERSLTALYARIARPRPRFEWVDSPDKALPLIGGLPTLEQLYRWVRHPRPAGPPPLASDVAMVVSRLRAALSDGVVHADLAHGFFLPVRAALPDGPVPACWYGQQDASWIAYYDALQRLGLARYGPDETDHFGHWAALARSCGWWWPGEDVCVAVERPATAHTGPLPGTWHDEVRLQPGGVRYRDGWHPQLT